MAIKENTIMVKPIYCTPEFKIKFIWESIYLKPMITLVEPSKKGVGGLNTVQNTSSIFPK